MGDYSGFDVKQLWSMVDAARSSLQPSRAQADALNKAQQMLNGHGQALKQARAQLADRWPPETNAAAAAYLVELDRLITAVDATALNCAVNVAHINLVSDAIVQSHETLKPLYEEYVANEGALAQYEKDVDEFGDGASIIPGGKTIAEGAKRLFSSPPVADGRQDELTRRVQQEMTSLAGAAQDGATRIQPPPPYEPPTVTPGIEDDAQNIGGGGGRRSSGGAVRPPRIDPPAHTRTSPGGAASDGTSASGGHLGGGAVPSPVPGLHSSPSGASGSGPALSGIGAPPVLPTPVQPLPATGAGPVPVPPAGPGVPVPGLLPGVLPGAGGGLPAGGLGPVGPNNRITSGVPAGRPAALRGPGGAIGGLRNGVIGGVPGTGGLPGAGGLPGGGGMQLRAGAQSRINPVGGVIGQQHGPAVAGAGRGSVRGTAANAGVATAPGGRRRPGGSPDGGQRWDPDNPWETAEGVDPVIAPDHSGDRIDPGPGIIGLHR
ncbi:hypothetical protein [Actinoplanes sp. NPDC049681]|uniref:hypothetical protein n=1 Tax=Actinoplanes sp. NPDC049681 TaxID=3363905 RepID=UPI00379D53E6